MVGHGKQRRVNEGGEGVYILPPPQVTVMCVFWCSRIIRGYLGSSGWVTELAKTHSKTPTSGSSGIAQTLPGAHKVPGSHHPGQGRIIRTWTERFGLTKTTRTGSSGLVQRGFGRAGRIIRPRAASSDPVQKAFVHKCFVS